MGYVYIFLTLALTTYGNLVFKWQVNAAGQMPATPGAMTGYIVSLFLNLWVISSFVAVFGAAVAWVGALNHFELSYAYNFMSLSFALVLVFSAALFGESLTSPKLIGVLLITLGVAIASKG